jgi:pimeloyl-ACP methyl ester carboxylesterase
MVLPRTTKVLCALLTVTSFAALGNGAMAEVRKAERGGVTVEYAIDGSGPVVLMIPSLGRPATDFDGLAAKLVAAGYTTIRPQPRGIGQSSGPMQGVSLRDLAADALSAVPAGSGPIVVIGHAFGQRVGRMLATEYPDRVRTMVMLADGGMAPMRPGAREALTAVFDTGLSPEKHMEMVKFAFFAAGNDATGWREGWYPKVAAMQMASLNAQKTEEWWGAGKASMLVVQALQDVVAPPENAKMIVGEFGNRVTVREIDGAGHAMLPERPDEIAKIVLDYLASHGK